MVPYLNLEYIYARIYDLATGGGPELSFLGKIVVALETIRPHGLTVAIVLAALIAMVFVRLRRVLKEEDERVEEIPEEFLVQEKTKNERWQKVLTLLEGPDQNSWRLAVLDADIMLDDMVASMSYAGENLGERLKHIERSDFTTLDAAWEAHKARNMIAHEGSDFILTQREARRIIGLFEEVFKEFGYI